MAVGSTFEERTRKVAEEYLRGERTWILEGFSRLEQGYTLFPVRNDELDCYLYDEQRVSRMIGFGEIELLLARGHCTNAKTVDALLKEIQAQKAS